MFRSSRRRACGSAEKEGFVKNVLLFTDGSCFGNPGAGGWGCLLRCGSMEKELSGSEANTTNNRMELRAVIAGLSALKEPAAVRVVTDSQYVQRGMTQYLPRWIRNSWVSSREVPAACRLQTGTCGKRCYTKVGPTKSNGPGFAATDQAWSRTD